MRMDILMGNRCSGKTETAMNMAHALDGAGETHAGHRPLQDKRLFPHIRPYTAAHRQVHKRWLALIRRQGRDADDHAGTSGLGLVIPQ